MLESPAYRVVDSQVSTAPRQEFRGDLFVFIELGLLRYIRPLRSMIRKDGSLSQQKTAIGLQLGMEGRDAASVGQNTQFSVGGRRTDVQIIRHLRNSVDFQRDGCGSCSRS